jgi:nitroreductase
METWDAVTSRRQVRSFTDEAIPDDHLRRILEAGRRAPSARNRQPWDFVVVRNRVQLERLAGVWQGASWTAGSHATIAFVLANADDPRVAALQRFDLGQAAMQMMITAADLAVATGQAACEDQSLAQELLGFPDGHHCALLIAIGYPADRPLRPIVKPSRRDYDDVVHFDTW